MIAAQKDRVNESALNTPASFKFSCCARSKKSPGRHSPGRIEKKAALNEKSRKKILQLLFSNWCPGGDSNSHAIRRYHLKIVCLPIPPPGHEEQLIEILRDWQDFFCCFRKKSAFFRLFVPIGVPSAVSRLLPLPFSGAFDLPLPEHTVQAAHAPGKRLPFLQKDRYPHAAGIGLSFYDIGSVIFRTWSGKIRQGPDATPPR